MAAQVLVGGANSSRISTLTGISAETKGGTAGLVSPLPPSRPIERMEEEGDGERVHGFARELVRRVQGRPRPEQPELPELEYGGADLGGLVTECRPGELVLGTGASLYARALLPALLSARREAIIVTCYWARSRTLTALREALEQLPSTRRRRDGQQPPPPPPLRVRICLSSVGLFQKLFHTSSRGGYTYPPSTWAAKLGLPPPAVLQAAGIDLRVKSLFFRPFSVVHAKFVLVDRERALLPSCNVSWEPWLEGCVEIAGPAVAALVMIYQRTWDDGQELAVSSPLLLPPPARRSPPPPPAMTSTADVVAALGAADGSDTTVQTIILPSSHHRNPGFRPFPWQTAPAAPPTPLNIALALLFESATRHIYVHTPNLTCPDVISSLLHALGRGVRVHVVTNGDMMVVEQLVTAGTTNSWCIKRLVNSYKTLRSTSRSHDGGTAGGGSSPRVGALKISYFRQRRQHGIVASSPRRPDEEQGGGGGASASEEPVRSHLKLTIVDGEFTVLGSGNMDRASWYTSQELGILFLDAALAARVKAAVDGVLEDRLDTVFDSAAEA